MELTKELARQFDERIAQRKRRRVIIERARQQETHRLERKEKDCA